MNRDSWAYRVPDTSMDTLSDALDVAGIAPLGLTEEAGTATAWFLDQPAGPLPLDGRWEAVAADDWAHRWKEGLEPVTAGDITISPPWRAPDGPVLDGPPWTLMVDPGMAFGTGHHETTLGCLGALQELPVAGSRVLDIGTGTGVLALAARVLGAAEVVAVDIDPEAVTVAEANVATHGLDRITVAEGSCDVVGAPGDVVIANIITDLLMALLPDLAAVLAPDGTLLCSGIDVARTQEAADAVRAAGLEPTMRPGREWTLMTARHARADGSHEKGSRPRANPGP